MSNTQILNEALSAKEKLVTLKHFGPGSPEAAQYNKK